MIAKRSQPPPGRPVLLVWGDDDFTVRQRARQVFDGWSAEIGGSDHEILDASASHGGEALRVLARLREALQTLPFFGRGKVVWLQNCSFLGEDRTASSQAVTAGLADLAEDLKAMDWGSVRLLISASKVDRRKTFFRTIEKVGASEAHAGLSIDDKDWSARAEALVEDHIEQLGKRIAPEAVARLVAAVGPYSRQLISESDKLVTYTGDRPQIEPRDVDAIAVRNKHAKAFGLAEAFGNRDLPRALKVLDEELWAVERDPQRSEIGLLYGIISKVRTLLLVKELIRAGHLRPSPDYNRVKAQLERVSPEVFAADKRFNLLAMHAFVVFQAAQQAARFTTAELVEAMDLLLAANRQLVSSDIEERFVLQNVFVRILSAAASDSGSAGGARPRPGSLDAAGSARHSSVNEIA